MACSCGSFASSVSASKRPINRVRNCLFWRSGSTRAFTCPDRVYPKRRIHGAATISRAATSSAGRLSCQRPTGAALMVVNWSSNIEFPDHGFPPRAGWRIDGSSLMCRNLHNWRSLASGATTRSSIAQHPVVLRAITGKVIEPGLGGARPAHGKGLRRPVGMLAPVGGKVIARVAHGVHHQRGRPPGEDLGSCNAHCRGFSPPKRGCQQ